MKKLKAIIAWCVSLFFILFGILPWGNTITNILFILTALCIMPPVADKISENFSKYTKKTKWITFTVLLISAFCTIPTTNVVEVNNNEVELYFSGEYSIDYLSAESIESDLNEDEDIKNKIVRFSVKKYVESAFGYNAQAGEHLNFISEPDLKLKENDEVIGKVTSFKKFLDTWIVYYDVIDIIPSIEEKIKEGVDQVTEDSGEITDNTDVDGVIEIPINIEKENNKPEIKDATEETKDTSEKNEQLKKEAEEKLRLEAEAKAKEGAEEKAKLEAEAKAKAEAEEKARLEAEAKAKAEAEEKARLEAEAKAKAEAEEKARLEAEAKAKKEAEEQAKKQQATSETNDEMVWIPTNGGERYHKKSTCSKMKNPEYVTKSAAKARGFTPCGICYK